MTCKQTIRTPHWPPSKCSTRVPSKRCMAHPLRQGLANHYSECVSSWTVSTAEVRSFKSVIKHLHMFKILLWQLIVSTHSKARQSFVNRIPPFPFWRSCGKTWVYSKLLWSSSFLYAKDFLTSGRCLFAGKNHNGSSNFCLKIQKALFLSYHEQGKINIRNRSRRVFYRLFRCL